MEELLEVLAAWRPSGPVNCMSDLRAWVVSFRSLGREAPDGIRISLTSSEAFLFAQTAPCSRPVCGDLYGVRVREEGHEHMEVPPPKWRMTVDLAPFRRDVVSQWVDDLYTNPSPCPNCNGSGRVCGVFLPDAWACDTCGGKGVV